jgi:hypothetical protein
LEKLNCYVKRVSIFLVTVALIAGMVGCAPPSQNLGIRTWYDLDAVRDNLRGHHILMNDLDSTTLGYTELASPTANGGKGWQPIGYGYWAGTQVFGEIFKGSFDGQAHEIRDLFINRPDDSEVGLFGFVGEGGIIKNISMMNATVTSGEGMGELVGLNENTVRNLIGVLGPGAAVGVLVGENYGTVSNSHSSGNVTGEWAVGGLVGANSGTLSNSYACGSVTGNSSVGGLVGSNNEGIVSNSYYNYDEVLINDESIITIGALFSEDFEEWLVNGKSLDVNDRLPQENGYYVVNNVTYFKELLAFGQNASLKFRLTNDLDLGDEPNFYIPYLAGEFDGNGHKISNLSLNFDLVSPLGLFGYLAPSGNVTQVGVENVNITACVDVGGLVGYNYDGTVSNSYSSGNMTGGGLVGGLVGASSGTVSNSYSTGSVTGEGWYVGGLVGWNDGTVSNSYATGSVSGDVGVGGLVGLNNDIVNNCYATGSVSGGSHVGGLVGWNEEGTVSNSSWDTQTSGQTISAGGTGKNTTEMQYIATFSGVGWNIIAVDNPGTRNPSYIWNIVNRVTYPFLSWQS